jgi:hypothetical protein
MRCKNNYDWWVDKDLEENVMAIKFGNYCNIIYLEGVVKSDNNRTEKWR